MEISELIWKALEVPAVVKDYRPGLLLDAYTRVKPYLEGDASEVENWLIKADKCLSEHIKPPKNVWCFVLFKSAYLRCVNMNYFCANDILSSECMETVSELLKMFPVGLIANSRHCKVRTALELCRKYMLREL